MAAIIKGRKYDHPTFGRVVAVKQSRMVPMSWYVRAVGSDAPPVAAWSSDLAPVLPGRPRHDDPRRKRSIQMTDAEWALVTANAKTQGLSVSAYIRAAVL
jgi:hypothetical protein